MDSIEELLMFIGIGSIAMISCAIGTCIYEKCKKNNKEQYAQNYLNSELLIKHNIV